RRRELEQAQALAAERARSGQRSKIGLGFACVLAIIAIYTAKWAFDERKVSEARALVARAVTLLDIDRSDPELALLLGLEAAKKADIPEVRSLLVTAAQYSW